MQRSFMVLLNIKGFLGRLLFITRLIFLVLICAPSSFANDLVVENLDTTELDEQYFLSIEELLKIKVKSTSLTAVKNNLTPVPVITISQEDIQMSGARSLDELLEIFVPALP